MFQLFFGYHLGILEYWMYWQKQYWIHGHYRIAVPGLSLLFLGAILCVLPCFRWMLDELIWAGITTIVRRVLQLSHTICWVRIHHDEFKSVLNGHCVYEIGLTHWQATPQQHLLVERSQNFLLTSRLDVKPKMQLFPGFISLLWHQDTNYLPVTIICIYRKKSWS